MQGGKCPLCENEQRLHPERTIQVKYDIDKMQGDHLIPWSKGGKTVEENCCMLCGPHNNNKSADEISWLNDYMADLRKQAQSK